MWKIDWDMLEEISPESEFNRKLKELIGNNLITEVNYDKYSSDEEDAGILSISFKGLNGKIIAHNGDKDPFVTIRDYDCDYIILSEKEKMALVEVKVKEEAKTGRIKEFYTFFGEQYDTLEEVTNAIESYAEDDGTQQTYYYEHHTVVECSHTIEATEKLVGEFDQETLDKVNEILKMKGIEFTIKGNK